MSTGAGPADPVAASQREPSPAPALDLTLARIERERLLAIVRVDGPETAVEATRGLRQGGIGVVEISLTTPDAFAALERCSQLDGDLLLGAGTVRTVAQARDAVAAGARFLVSPTLDPELVRWAAEAQVAHLPGILTPTELAEALRAGARLVKLFPAGRMGPAYVRDLLAPLPEARLVATGAIGAGEVGEYLDAGAVAVALGSALVSTASARDPAALAAAIADVHAAIASRQSRRPSDGH